MPNTHTLAAAALLSAWEYGAAEPVRRRALALLSAALPDQPRLADWSLGKRDHFLLRLRESLFGPRMESVSDCPECGARVEFELDARALQTGYAESAIEVRFEHEGREHAAMLRAPSTADLDAISERPSREALLRQCLEWNAGEGGPEITPAVFERLNETLAGMDPQALLELDLQCAECGHGWEAAFDIASYVWAEVDAWAIRTLAEVHQIASRYGWSEAEILGMSASRRQIYLRMVTA
jgi:hypothetical protein